MSERYEVVLVRDVILTDGSGTHSTVVAETAAGVLECDPSLFCPIPGYALPGQWRVVRAEKTEEPRP
jgi:hypothetical protein